MRRYSGKCDIFFGIKHRLRKEEMEKQFNREAKEGWRFAADAARITDESLVAVDSNLGAVAGAEEGAIESITGSEGRLTQAWENVRGGLRVLSVYFWHSEGWTPKKEALLEAVLMQARTTKHPWLVACDANMCPDDFDKSIWFQRNLTHVVAPKEVSTCRSKGPNGEWIERTYDKVIACCRLTGKIS